jgi:hypothetical protein
LQAIIITAMQQEGFVYTLDEVLFFKKKFDEPGVSHFRSV